MQVGTYGRSRANKRRKVNNKNNGRGKDWLLRKKEQMRKRGREVPAVTKYTGVASGAGHGYTKYTGRKCKTRF